jgi:hypothetical protein
MSGWKMAVGSEIAKYKFDLVEYRISYGTKGALNQHRFIEFSVGHGAKIVN